MKARHLIFLLALLACFLLPWLAGQAGEEAGLCPKPFIKFISPWVGNPGMQVTIHGERFGAPRGEVIFTERINSPLDLIFAHPVKAKIASWTYRRIWVIVPQSAATGPVFVKIHCGAESNTVEFTVKK
jgi:hypothetical protein